MRPAALAQDDTPMLPVVQHAIDALTADGWTAEDIVLLQPTSPLRRAEHIRDAVTLLRDSDADSVVTVVELPRHLSPDYVMRIEDGRCGRSLPRGRASDPAPGRAAGLLARRHGLRLLARHDRALRQHLRRRLPAAARRCRRLAVASTRRPTGTRPSGCSRGVDVNSLRATARSAVGSTASARCWRAATSARLPRQLGDWRPAAADRRGPLARGGRIRAVVLGTFPGVVRRAVRRRAVAAPRRLARRHGLLVRAFAGSYRDVFDYLTPEAYKARHDARVATSGNRSRRGSRGWSGSSSRMTSGTRTPPERGCFIPQ